MKIYINKYKYNWISPYTVKEKFFFWKKDYDAFKNEPPKWLSHLCNGWYVIAEFFNRRIEYVHIDSWDTWNMNTTLAIIILPMLKQIKQDKHGAPFVDDKDVPKELKSTSAGPRENSWDTDDNHFKRWDWVLDEMIWAFEQLQPDCDWESQYHTGVIDIVWVPNEDNPDCCTMTRGPNDTSKFDAKGYKKHQDRIYRGTTLFGKYYQGLWD